MWRPLISVSLSGALRGGRLRKITIETLKMAMAAISDPKTKSSELANRLGITKTTLYAYVMVTAP